MVVLLEDDVDVDVEEDVLVDVEVDVVVVSHPVQVLSHCFATTISPHNPTERRSSHLACDNIFTLLAHLCKVDVVVVEVEVEVDVLVEVDVDVEVLVDDDVDVLVEVLVDVDVEVDVDVDVDVVVPHTPSLSASLSACKGQESSFPQIPSLSTSFSGSKSHLSKHSDLHVQGHTLHAECAIHLPSLAPPRL